MALERVQDPQFAGKNEAEINRNNYLPREVFHRPEWQQILFEQSPKWWMQSFLQDYCGTNDPISDNSWNWVEEGKLYQKETIAAAENNGDGTYDLTLDNTDPFFVQYDVIDLGTVVPGSSILNVHGQVMSTGTSGGQQVITIKLLEGAADFAGYDLIANLEDDNHEIALKTNLQVECFKVPESRMHTPDKYTNTLNKVSNTSHLCDEADDQILWFKTTGGSFYWTHYDDMNVAALHRMHADSACLWGQESQFVDQDNNKYEGESGKGIMQFVDDGGLLRSYAGSLVEDDFSELVTQLAIFSKYNKWHVVCGPEFYKEAQKAMKDYFVQGGVMYGSFSGEGIAKVGIYYHEYQFGNKTLVLMEYDGFSDPDFLPQNPNQGIDYQNFGLVLNLEGDSMKLQYKKRRRGGVWKDHINIRPGHGFADDGGLFVNDRSCLETVYRTHVGVEMKGLNNHGAIFKE